MSIAALIKSTKSRIFQMLVSLTRKLAYKNLIEVTPLLNCWQRINKKNFELFNI